MSKTFWSSAVACALLAGCAVLHPRIERAAKMQSCASGKACEIAVNVACTHFYGCELSVDYDLVLVEERGQRTTIVWHLTGEPGEYLAAAGVSHPFGTLDLCPFGMSRHCPCSLSLPSPVHPGTVLP